MARAAVAILPASLSLLGVTVTNVGGGTGGGTSLVNSVDSAFIAASSGDSEGGTSGPAPTAGPTAGDAGEGPGRATPGAGDVSGAAFGAGDVGGAASGAGDVGGTAPGDANRFVTNVACIIVDKSAPLAIACSFKAVHHSFSEFVNGLLRDGFGVV